MGYRAPRAEDVYRYLFRLDRGTSTSLSDGFSWSILFVNDSSPLCREFLAEYGAELCYRTADRIRFVFFSGLDEDEFQRPAYEANRGGGFLKRVIQAALNRTSPRRYDWERDDWEMLRPEAFRPLDSQEQISRQISWEVELHSAMPGSREAHRLAQTLGIGRFIPCFLLFSDIGSPTARLFPIATKSPHEVYQRLRVWVDSFYEINHVTLTRWKSIEESIAETARAFESSLNEVASWKRTRETQLDALQRVSKYVNQLANSAPDTALVREIKDDWTIPLETRDLLTPFLHQLEAIDQKPDDARKVREWLNRLRAITDLELLKMEWSKFKHKHADKLPKSARISLSAAISQLNPSKHPSSAHTELVNWWRSEFVRPPSKKRFRNYRLAWVNYSKFKYDSAAVGHISRIINDEFAIILPTVLEQPIVNSPQDGAQQVINRLATHLSVAQDDHSWADRVSDYRQVLTDFFTNLQSHAPSWLTKAAVEVSPTLCWKDCLPRVDRSKARDQDPLDELPRLREILERTQANWESHVQDLEERHRERQISSVAELIATIDAWLASLDLIDADRQSVWLALIASLSTARQHFEDQIFKDAKNAPKAPYPGKLFSQDETSQLLRLLDEYDRAVRSISFPFEADHEVLKVALDTSLLSASGITMQKRDTPATQIKKRLLNAAKEAENSVKAWKSVQKEAQYWSPSGKLLSAMKDVLSRGNMAAVLSTMGVIPESEAIDILTNRDQATSLLDSLSVQELIALENRLVQTKQTGDRAMPATKQELFDSILVAVGFLPVRDGTTCLEPANMPMDKLETLRDKVSRGIFDVFLAHNSHDRSDVLRLSQELRRHGIYPWVDVEQIAPGRWFQDVIQSAVRTVKTAAVIIGSSGLGRWQALELRAFVSRCVEHEVPLIPILLPGVTAIPDDLPFLRELNYVKFKNDVNEQEGLSKLIWGITGERH